MADNRLAGERAWLRAAIDATGLKPTPFATRAGIAPSTITRFLAGTSKSGLERRTIELICQTYGLAPPPFAATPAAGFAEPDIAPHTEQPPVFAGVTLTADQYVATVNTSALDLDGVLPGDAILFDMALAPAAGDVVAAQVYRETGAITVLRLYEPPFLVVHTTERTQSARPLLVDGERVKIAAVARIVHRQRR